MLSTLLVALLVAMLGGATPTVAADYTTGPCGFNSMCTCSSSKQTGAIGEVRCVGVPFGLLPDLPSGPLSFVELLNSGLERLDKDDFKGLRVETLRLMSNRITWIDPDAFKSLSHSLSSVDISFNRLYSLPHELFRAMSNVTFINLHGLTLHLAAAGSNYLHELRPADWHRLRHALGQAFLGNNDLCRLEAGTLASLRQLVSLNLESNQLQELPADALPVGLQVLNVNSNRLTQLPLQTLRKLHRLKWLYFEDNYIKHLPSESLGESRRMSELHLAHNRLEELPRRLFNGSVRLQDLYLQYNQLTSLRRAAFSGLHLARLFLEHNRIIWIDENAFHGVAHSLIALDLEGNQLSEVPAALQTLRELRKLILSSNGIADVPPGALEHNQATLESLSLAGNQLEAVPAAALRGCSQLLFVDLGRNRIRNISADELLGWAGRLEHLLLHNNLLTRLPDWLFSGAPALRELSLSFNQLTHFSPESLADLSDSLHSLEASFALRGAAVFPRELIAPLKSLRLLAVDNNGFEEIAETALYHLNELEYVNLESNRLRRLPSSLLHRKVHRLLRDVRLSYNLLERLERQTFSDLAGLQSVALTGNSIGVIDNLVFHNLSRLVTVLLGSNRLTEVGAGAFHSLPKLVQLDLQDNQLRDFSLKVFHNVTNDVVPLTLNLSRNWINALYPYPTGAPMYVKTLDLSHNQLPEVPADFLEGVALSLRRLDLSFNRIDRLDDNSCGQLESLRVLSLRGNQISRLRTAAFHSIRNLQLLDLSHNAVAQLPAGLFHRQWTLRHLTLAHNRLEALPQALLHSAPLESLDLSHNALRALPAAALAATGATLAHLDMTGNRLEQLDGVTFGRLPRLSRLSLARNRLTVLPDTVFLSLPRLLSLDLSGNPLRTNYKELFHYLQTLQELALADVGLTKAPDLPLPNLITLNVSRNDMTHVPFGAFAMLKKLRVLDLSGNNFSAVPSQTWMHTPLLRTLHMSANPIQILNEESFNGLDHMRELSLLEQYRLIRFDTDTLLPMRELEKLSITTCPQIEKYRFRLGSVLNGLRSLRRLHVEVRETKLEDQLHGGFGNKLKELRLTGRNLQQIDPEAFQGFEGQNELVLQLRDTSISGLPDDLLRHFRDVTSLTLDLRRNRLINMSPNTLYRNGSDWEMIGTGIIKGGIALGENHWVCDCGLTWLGQWKRRWLRESLRIHTAGLRSAQHVQQLVRQATCTDLRTGVETPIVDLRAEELRCRLGAVAGAGRPPAAPLLVPPLLLLLLMLLLHLLGVT